MFKIIKKSRPLRKDRPKTSSPVEAALRDEGFPDMSKITGSIVKELRQKNLAALVGTGEPCAGCGLGEGPHFHGVTLSPPNDFNDDGARRFMPLPPASQDEKTWEPTAEEAEPPIHSDSYGRIPVKHPPILELPPGARYDPNFNPKQIRICGVNYAQILHLIRFYELETGHKAADLPSS